MSLVIGLTGQSGAGKTTVSKIFAENGFAVIDCDKVSRQVTEKGSACCRELAGVFPACFGKGFELDRAAIAKEVFSDRERLELLNSIIYPYITELIKERISEFSKECQYILLDAPTLFEAGADSLCDDIAAVTADEGVRLGRITARDKIDRDMALKRFGSQHSEGFFKEHCKYVIKNDGDQRSAAEQTKRVIEMIKGSTNGKKQ